MAELPDGTKRVVLLDTNGYRRLAKGATPTEARSRAESLVAYERSAGVVALGSSTVLMELLVHLADPDDPVHADALASVVAAATHCMMSDGSATHIAICPNPDLQLCHSLWGEWPDELLTLDNVVRELAWRVAQNPTTEQLEASRPDLRVLAEEVRQSEKRFTEGMKIHLIDHVRNGLKEEHAGASRKAVLNEYRERLASEQVRRTVAEAHVRRAMSYLSRADDDTEIAQKAAFVETNFGVAIALYTDLARTIAESNVDLDNKRASNHLWDLQLAFLVGNQHMIAGRPMTLVSSDGNIVKAAERMNVQDAVISYDAYRRRLRGSGK